MIATEWDRCQAALVGKSDDDEYPLILEPITSVSSIRTWDYSLPTLTRSRRFTPRKTFSGTSGNDDFIDVIKKHNDGFTYAILESIGVFKETNDIVLYGGSLLDILLNRDDVIHDWDLRLIGPQYIDNEPACIEKAKEFVATVFQFLRSENKRTQEKNQQWKDEGLSKTSPLVPLYTVKHHAFTRQLQLLSLIMVRIARNSVSSLRSNRTVMSIIC